MEALAHRQSAAASAAILGHEPERAV